MKRIVAVCLMAGVLLAMSTAAFASPITVPLSNGSLTSDSIVTTGFNTVRTTPIPGNPGTMTITWFQPFSLSAVPAAPSATPPYPAGGTYNLATTITGGTLTIWANGISTISGMGPNPERDYVWAGPSSSGSTWTAIAPPAYLNPGSSSVTAFVVSNPTTLATLTGTTGSYIQVRVSDYPANSNDAVTKSELYVTGTYAWTYTYEPPTNPNPDPAPEPIPAPGAILLASMGAGLVSWLRARKSL